MSCECWACQDRHRHLEDQLAELRHVLDQLRYDLEREKDDRRDREAQLANDISDVYLATG